MNQLSQVIQGFSYFLAKRLDKSKQDTPILWFVTTLLMIILLVAIHADWFIQLHDWVKMTVEGLIVGTLSMNGSRTTQKLAERKAKVELEIVPEILEEPNSEIVENMPISETPPAMQLVLKRYLLEDTFSIGDLFINGGYFCKTLEDKNRGLDSTMSLEEIKKLKVYGQTCIPTGTYQVVISYSNRFKKLLPELILVPGYQGIRIHAGNIASQSSGCILVGDTYKDGKVLNSIRTMSKLMTILRQSLSKQKIFITIENAS